MNLEKTRCWRIFKVGCPSRPCQIVGEALEVKLVERATIEESLAGAGYGHS